MPPKKKPDPITLALQELQERVTNLEQKILGLEKPRSIQKVETFNGEEAPEPHHGPMKMNHEEQLFSMTNAAKILPPNLIKNGRHARENIQALVGFLVSEEMMDEMYATFKHEVF